MLKLREISKDYVMSDEVVHAIRGLSLNFRRNEFVAILGPSGCGKTTLLNIIGGLDRYTSGDLIIKGKSTKEYRDRDWDTYRNHSIGFVFQSYNLIGHLSVLANVELALTLAGVSRAERKARAMEALTIVGLKDKAKKKPNQLSGGQMQRVAIARALINDPEILLADEPTGALDSETSVQVLNLLKEVAKNRLVIMVTHNQNLANKYATRIITMSDGKMTGDTKPYAGETASEIEKFENEQKETIAIEKRKHSAMSFKTALGLSFNNMMTKKGRTILVSFAGSIGIIGIALIMSVSFGFDNYINAVETDAMSTYPMTIYASSNMNSILASISSRPTHELPQYSDNEEIIENTFISDLLETSIEVTRNDTASFKAFLEKESTIEKYGDSWNGIQYTYSQDLQIYKKLDVDTGNLIDGIVNLTDLDDRYSYLSQAIETYRTDDPAWTSTHANFYKTFVNATDPLNPGSTSIKDGVMQRFKSLNFNAFTELLDNEELLNNQYDVLAGHLPQAYNEVVLSIDAYNEINDYLLFGTGIKDASYWTSKVIYSQLSGTSLPFGELPEPTNSPKLKKNFSDLLDLTFSLGIKTQRYKKVIDETTTLGYYYENQYASSEMKNVTDNSLELKIVGILRNKPDVNIASIKGAIGYSPELLPYLIDQTSSPTEGGYYEDATVLKDQLSNLTYDVLTGELFDSNNNLSTNTENFGYIDKNTPEEIRIYPKDFANKQKIVQMIEDYNASADNNKKITVSDVVGELFVSFQAIVDSVSYVLIAFVSISLIVSSIMIGIITYVSVLERTKEIGILRSVGARKKDISRVFTAETLIIGLLAGLLGVGLAFLIDIPVMLIINYFANLSLFITVPWYGALLLPAISVVLTLVSGLIPSSLAAKKDPVVALRSE